MMPTIGLEAGASDFSAGSSTSDGVTTVGINSGIL